MKKRLVILLLIVSAHPLFAQDRAMVNGKEHYVYPYQEEIEVPLDLFFYKMELVEAVQRDSMNRKIVEVELEIISPSRYYARRYTGPFKKIILGMRKVRPTMLIGSNLPLEKDITPYLQPLPDGEYVQYYRDIPYLDGKTVRFKNDIVCARFGLKNNLLDGPAVWYTVDGDTMKFGNFTAGEKTGAWEHRQYSFSPPEKKPQLAKFLDHTYRNITRTNVNYVNGLLDGKMAEYRNDTLTDEGNFHNGESAGEWKRYTRKVTGLGFMKVETREMILSTHYNLLEKPTHAKSVIIRNSITSRSQFYPEFNIPYDEVPIGMSEFYKLYVEEPEEGLELPGENFRSYPGEEQDEYGEYSEELSYRRGDRYNYQNAEDISFENAEPGQVFNLNGKPFTRNELIDSLGYSTYLDGLYEKFYDNGELMMRFTVENGIIHEPDTVFWNTGAPASVLKHYPERKEYNEIITDLDGKIMFSLIYDEKGKFLRDEKEHANPDEHTINGRTYHSSMFQSYYFYNEENRFDSILTSPVIETSILWKSDSTVAMENTFDPATRELKFTELSIDKTKVKEESYQFSEDYSNLSGTETVNFGKIRSVSQLNGSFYVNPMFPEKTRDTLLTRRVRDFEEYFEITKDQVVYLNDRPFSGNFRLDAHAPVSSLTATDKLISIGNGMGPKAEKQLYAARKSFNKTHRPNAFTPFLTYSVYNYGFTPEIKAVFPFLTSIYDQVSGETFSDYESETPKAIPESKAPQFDKYVEGQFINGKPDGRWIAKDQYGKITSEVNFVNGELEGEARYYKTTQPATLEDFFDGAMLNPELKYALPEKPVYHLYYVRHFHKGIQSGVAYELNWLGDTLFYASYADDEKTGMSYERTKIAFSRSYFEYGSLNGIMQTYLTLPGKDSSLLYDLNFRNGTLQGESKSYHLNGNLAKHGFFLGGEPIDDFEAYDTLGFKYQYVKFQYGQPVEEKIWEENLLSVRYLFDWHDSIPFEVGDIAGSQSLERELYRLGVYGGDYSTPYYGRPSLVSKVGIRYEMTKFYPNNLMARHGFVNKGKKEGKWEYYSYEGTKVYDVNYFDTIITTPAGVRFKSKGILTDFDEKGNPKSRSYMVERFEKYDCAHTDHLEERMMITIWEKDTAVHRMNGFVKNYYDNGVVQNEGIMKNGIATGVWKFYDPYGNLNKVGVYLDGKRDGRWLSGDLGNLKYMGDICLNPNLENLEEIISYEEKLLDITVTYYQKGVVRKSEYYGINANPDGPPEEGME